MAQYKEGRVTVTTDSDIVTGTDTQWMSNVDPGDIFLVRGDEVPYRVAAVISDFSLRLNARYSAPTETNTYYSITRDFTQNFNLPIIRNGDVDAVPLFAEGLILLDAKLGAGGGGGGATSLGGLIDVSVTGAQAGDTFTKLANGTYGFVAPYVFTIAFDHAPGDGARIFKGYANGVVTARRIKAAGGTVNENADDITINIPAPGEVNTLDSAGSSQSQSLAATKSGVILRTKGIRAGTNITLTPEGNDIVIASTASGSGGSVTYTMAPIGAGTPLVAAPSGTEFRIKSLAFDSNFTIAEPVGGGVGIALNKLPISQISTIAWDSILAGQVLTRNVNGTVTGLTLPAAGITALVQDLAPKLGGPLDIAGKRVIGMPVSFSGVFERPKAKTYTICLSAPALIRLDAVTAVTKAGSLSYRIDVSGLPEGGDTMPESPLQGTATMARVTASATAQVLVEPSQAILLTLSAISADIDDFTYTISGTTV